MSFDQSVFAIFIFLYMSCAFDWIASTSAQRESALPCCVRICPRGPNQVSDTFCFGSSLMDEIFICAIDQEGTGPKLSV